MNWRTGRGLIVLGLLAIILFHVQVGDAATKDGLYQRVHQQDDQHHAVPAKATAKGERYKQSVQAYALPDVTLLNQDGKKVRLREVVDSGKPVVLNFIFSTCTTVCPVLGAGFASFQDALGAEAAKTTLLSVSIDPDHDTPSAMKKYLRRYGARPGWEFLTGRYEDITQVMKAFDAYAVNKMNHFPLTFLRAPGSDKWVRIDGLLSTSDLVAEYRKALKP